MGSVRSVNIGVARRLHTGGSPTGIDKRPVAGRLAVRSPGPKGLGASGLAGDAVCNKRHHGGDDQALYAYDGGRLDEWAVLLGRELADGSFGENLTTVGIDLDDAPIGTRWRIGTSLVVQVTGPRIPCGVFARRMAEDAWIERFDAAAHPGTYLRVVTPGDVGAGDEIVEVHRPTHGVRVVDVYRAYRHDRALLPGLLAAGDDLPADTRADAARAASRRGS